MATLYVVHFDLRAGSSVLPSERPTRGTALAAAGSGSGAGLPLANTTSRPPLAPRPGQGDCWKAKPSPTGHSKICAVAEAHADAMTHPLAQAKSDRRRMHPFRETEQAL